MRIGVKQFLTVMMLVILFGMIYPLKAADIEITTSINRTKVSLNQDFTLTIEISGDKANQVGDPIVPDIDDFAVYLGSSGTAQNIQIINGKMSVTRSQSFMFKAVKMGNFTIPPAEVVLNGKRYRSQPIQIEIGKATTPQQQPKTNKPRSATQTPDETGEGALYLDVSVNKRQVYVNEPVIVSYKIYTQVSVTQYGINRLPNTAGFWVEEYDLGTQPKMENKVINGKKFIVAEIKRMALFPTDVGKKTIGSMEIECNVRVQQRRRSIFDSFFDDPFFGRSVRKLLTSKSVTINVKPLPDQGKPTDFSGLVGNFNISANVDKKDVTANEAISLKIEIGGKGNIKQIPNPEVELPSDFEQYPPKISQKISRTDDGVVGSKTLEYVLIPRYPGTHKIKPIRFSYFDLSTGKYKTAQTREIVINVAKSEDQFVTGAIARSKEDVKLLGKDIRYIQLSASDFHKISAKFYERIYFFLIFIVPILGLIAAFGYRRHQDKLSGNIAYARSRKANQVAMKRLHKAKKLLSEETQKEFYAEVSNAMLGFLGDKFNMSAAGIITDEVEALMKERGIDQPIIQQYLGCLQTCDYQRFAPSNSKIENMKQFYHEAKEAIIALEKII